MDYKFVILIAAYVAMIAELVYLPFRGKKIISQAGELKMKLKNKVRLMYIGFYIFCFALPVVLLFREYSTLINVMFALVSVMACELASRDACLTGRYGVYEKCVIAGGVIVEYDDIVTFPVLEFPEEEREKYDHSCLVAATASKGSVNIVFSNEKECDAATEIIRDLSGK